MGRVCRQSRFLSEPRSFNGGYGLPPRHWVGDGFTRDPSVAEKKNGRILRIQTTDFNIVQTVIANADIAVIPRMHCAGFPMKLLNYLALGCVTLVSEGKTLLIYRVPFAFQMVIQHLWFTI